MVETEIVHAGRIKWFDQAKNYGFISRPDAGDVFLHAKSVTGSVEKGTRVEFIIRTDKRGRIFADQVREVDADAGEG